MKSENKVVTLEFGVGTCMENLTAELNKYDLSECIVSIGYKPLFLGVYVVLKVSDEKLSSLPNWLNGFKKLN